MNFFLLKKNNYKKNITWKQSNSFTIIEMIVVVGVLSLIIGGLMLSMREIIRGELMLKKMQRVEEESRFIMDVFAQDASYSEIDDTTWSDEESSHLYPDIVFNFAEKKSDIEELSDVAKVTYGYYNEGSQTFYITRKYQNSSGSIFYTTLNSVPLYQNPTFFVKKVTTPDGGKNYLVNALLVFKVSTGTGDQINLVPIGTSVMSRTFEY